MSLQFYALEKLVQLNNFCRDNKVAFLYAYTGGVSATIFVDLGPAHVVNDPNGDRPIKKVLCMHIHMLAVPLSFLYLLCLLYLRSFVPLCGCSYVYLLYAFVLIFLL